MITFHRFFGCVILMGVATFSGFSQVIVEGQIVTSPNWERKLYVLRLDRIKLSAPYYLVDSIMLNEDGYFLYNLKKDNSGLWYEFRMPPKGGNWNSLVSGSADNWFNITNEDKGRITIQGFSDSLYYSHQIKGTGINNKLLLFRDIYTPIFKMHREFESEMRSHPENREILIKNLMQRVLQAAEDSKIAITSLLDTAQNKSLIVAGIYHLNRSYLNKLDFDLVRAYSNRLKDDEPLIVKNIKQLSTKTNVVKKGYALPDVMLLDSAQNKIKLSEIRGKYKVIDFWASWCGPCRAANRNALPQLNDMLKSKGIPLIAISIDHDVRNWKQAIIKDKASWKQYREQNPSLTKVLGVEGIPRYIIVDKTNTLVFDTNVIMELERMIETLDSSK